MSKVDYYRAKLRELHSWDAYLLEQSNLPGPRANLELAFAVGLEGDEDLFLRYAALEEADAPANAPEGFLAVCGVLGLGYLIARGGTSHLAIIRKRASDNRWRIREAVALGLQQYGVVDLMGLLSIMEEWSHGNLSEQRAVIVTLCEPKLIKDGQICVRILNLLDRITGSILNEDNRKKQGFQVLKKSLGYCWSVLVASCPELGKPQMEKWMKEDNPDIRWIMKQNLKKKRLERIDAEWVSRQLATL